MVPSSHCAPSLDEAHPATHGAEEQPSRASVWSLLSAPGVILDAVREGLAAHRRYEHLRSRGMPHDAALGEALGLGASRRHATRETAKSLYFAGRA
jgi:hypothetical protein